MICKQCNNPLPNGQLVCPICGHQGPLTQERERLEELREEQRRASLNATHKPLFLAMAICFTLAAVVCGILPMLQSDFSGLITAVFMGISTFGLWCCYFAKDNESVSRALRDASFFDGYNRVICILFAILDGLIMGGISVLSFSLLGSEGRSGMDVLLTAVGIASAVMGIIIVAAVLLISSVYKSRRAYFMTLSKYAGAGSYPMRSVPVVGSCIIGAFKCAGGLLSLMLSAVSGTMSGSVSDIVSAIPLPDDLPNAEEIIPMVEGLMLMLATAMLVKGIGEIVMGVYYIISGVWMSRVNDEARRLNSEIDHQNVKRLELERSSKVAYELFLQKKAEERREFDAKSYRDNSSEESADKSTVTEADDGAALDC